MTLSSVRTRSLSKSLETLEWVAGSVARPQQIPCVPDAINMNMERADDSLCTCLSVCTILRMNKVLNNVHAWLQVLFDAHFNVPVLRQTAHYQVRCVAIDNLVVRKREQGGRVAVLSEDHAY